MTANTTKRTQAIHKATLSAHEKQLEEKLCIGDKFFVNVTEAISCFFHKISDTT